MFLETIPESQCSDTVKAMYERQKNHYGYLPNYAAVFAHRPEVLNAWSALISTIRTHTDGETYELITLAAALELGNSYCSLAHGDMLNKRLYSVEEVIAIARQEDLDKLSSRHKSMMELARKVVRNSSRIVSEDIEALRVEGLTEGEIFDTVAIASARCFFAKLVDGLGAQPDVDYRELDARMREELSRGRAIATSRSESDTPVEDYSDSII
ncbi:MAG: putative peroxidase-related enzyme [Halieaceae bacterium]|jgi:uncharacterized peroxidase-related enzyme